MADALVQSATGSGTSASPAATWGATTTNGNTLVATLACRSGSGTTITPPSGWVLAHREDGVQGQFATYYILASAARSGAETWTITSNPWTLCLMEFSGLGANVTLDQVAWSPITTSNGQAAGVEAVTGGSHTLSVFLPGYGRNTTTTYTRVANDGPYLFTEVADVIRNVSTHVRQVPSYRFDTDYSTPLESSRIASASGAGISSCGILVVFRDAVAATPPDAGTAGGAAAEVQRISNTSTGAGNTLGLTLGSDPAVGSLLVIAAAIAAVTPLSGILVPSGYTLAKEVGGVLNFDPTSGLGEGRMAVFWKVSAGAADKTATVDFQQSSSRTAWLIEFSGSNLGNVDEVVAVYDDTTVPIGSWNAQVTGTDFGFPIGLGAEAAVGMWVAFLSASATTPSTDLDGGFSNVAVAGTTVTVRYFNKSVSVVGRPRLTVNPTAASRFMGVIVAFGTPPVPPVAAGGSEAPLLRLLKVQAEELPYQLHRRML